MKLVIQLQFFISFLVLSTTLNAQSEKPNKIGFALSGGGAKGLAHIGVLKVLEEEGIYPDYITGTSMGSVVGGLYAIGYNVDFLDSLARTMEWNKYFTDQYDRSYLPIEEKDIVERYFASFPIENKKIQLPKGFVDGGKLGLLLDQLTIPVHSIDNFDDFPIPFRCVATDLETGEAVVFKNGFLPEAIRASIGIPTVFEPLEVNNVLLVDGGVARNLPVVDVENMGADYVIAFDVGATLYSKKDLNSIIKVLDQTNSYRIVESNQEQLDRANFVIRPKVEGHSGLDFSSVDSLIAIGEQAARRILPDLKKELNSIGYNYYVRKNQSPKTPAEVNIHSIEIFGVGERAQKILMDLLQIKLPKMLSLEKINEKFSKIAATGFYKKVDYRLLFVDDGFTLVIHAKESEGKYLKLGINFDSDYNAAILLNTTFRNVGFRGSKLSLDLRVSKNPALIAEYLVYTKTRPNVGFNLTGMVNLYPGSLYNNHKLIQQFNYRHGKVGLDLFSGISKDLSFSLGISSEFLSQNQKFLDDIQSSKNSLRQTSIYAKLILDTYNRKYFPTEGSKLLIQGNLVIEGQIKNEIETENAKSVIRNKAVQLQFSQVFKLSRRVTLLWSNYGAVTNYQTADYINLFYLGRSLSYEPQFIPFTGFKYMEQPADGYGYTGVRFQFEPFDGKFISVDYNAGIFHSPKFTVEENDGELIIPEMEGSMSGAGLELGLNSSLGPIIFRTEYNFETKFFNFILQLGFTF